MDSKFTIRAINRYASGSEFDPDKEKQWVEPFYFIQASDPQFGFLSSMEELPCKDPLQEEIRRAKASVAVAKKLQPKPRFFIVCGDMTHAYPSNVEQDLQRDLFRNIFSELEPEIPLLCVCGNHDVGQIPTPETIDKYTKSYGDDYYSFWCGGVLCIVLNSQYYDNCSQVKLLAAEQEKWLNSLLRVVEEQQSKYSIIFQHIPWFLISPNEKNQYFNIDVEIREKMLTRFKSAGVNAVFCGHYHRNAGGFDDKLEVVVTTAIGAQLGDDKPGMRIVKILENEIKHEFHEFDSFPTEVEL